MRRPSACSVCRPVLPGLDRKTDGSLSLSIRRRKCEASPEGGRCVYCAAKNLHCARSDGSFLPPPAPPESPLHRASRAPGVDEDMAICAELVELYFTYIHDQYHSLFHRPSFMKSLNQGTAPPVVVYAMMALSARFSDSLSSDGTPLAESCERFTRDSESLLNLREMSLTTIQACILLGAACIGEGNAAAESVYYSAASRIANYLNLPALISHDPLTREIHLRVYWTLCMIDLWSSDGLNLSRQMTRRDAVALPMNETMFLQMQRDKPNDLPHNHDHRNSLLAQMIMLNCILLEVNDGIKTVIAQAPTLDSDETTDNLSSKLDDWERALPEHMRDTPANLHAHASLGLGRFFAAIYLGYYHFGQLLFYQYLDEHRRYGCAQPQVSARARRCKAFAMSLSRFIDKANATPGCDVRYYMVGHITVVASSVLIHTLLFGTDEAEITAARSQLERNFNTLLVLRRYWPALEMCFARLRSFQQLCRNSMDTSFRMDRWMMSFLTEFSRPLDNLESEKRLELNLEPWSLIDL